MGGRPEMAREGAGVSVVLGILVLAASALFLADWREPLRTCEDRFGGIVGDFCRPYRYFVVGAGMGAIAGAIQVLSSIIGFLKRGKIWAIVQLVVVVLLVIAFSVPVAEKAHQIETEEVPGPYSVYRWKALAFIVVIPIDVIASLVLAQVVFMNS